ncbi:phage regulatory CII family protein [Vibrio alginolyticus]|uniref:phage regulatory CII family protein n=1 Tax=Vibrio alginolyticus TaxID=663 RepID=UPI00215E5F6B|nr:phage regulatory CII family protein [Vibrio alginolyticus]EMD1210311.1 phage regulatory CII family protein [Vibrio alginolyticus]MCS0165192.1 phage regulatory CII family protein [Vibrio alginolyticus]
MDINNSMCVLRERKQQAFDAACCDFVVNHDVEAIARRLELNGTMLRNMLNPNQPHVLKPVVLASISRVSGDYSIVNTLFADDGVVTIPLPKAEDNLNLFERFLKLNTHSGELSSDALAMCTAERLPRSRKRKTLAKAQAALGNLVLLINDLENRTTGLQPLMQMGTDFLANGAPLPGLA